MRQINYYKKAENESLDNQEALNHKNAILEAQLNSTSDGMIIDDQAGKRVLQNKRVSEIWNIPDYVHYSGDWKLMLSYVKQMTTNPEEFAKRVEYLITNPDIISLDIIDLNDGTVLERYSGPVVGKDGKYYGRIWAFHDVTEYKKVERLLAAEKEFLSITLQSIGDGVITTDTDGKILLINNVAQNLTGWDQKEAVGQPFEKIFRAVNEITRQVCESPVSKVLKTGETIERANYSVLLSKNGSEIVISDSAAPIKNDEGRMIGVILVFRDMTEKLKIQESMQRTQKLESLGVFAGGIAHDFNNLLCGIFGLLEIAKVSSVDGKNDLVVEYLNEAIKVFERARALTQQLLTFSKGGVPVLKTVCFEPLIRRCTQFVLCGSNIECEFTIEKDLWTCDCDEHQMEQVIDNVVINARQAMPDGGKITVSAANSIINPDKEKTHLDGGRYIRISIKDNGTGIPKEHLNKIFDPFFSTKEKGHGLGLATVFSIIKRHNGWIDVESESGKGSVFHIFLPASVNGAIQNNQVAAVNFKGFGTILIMDDEEFILKVINQMLVKMGFTCVQTRSGHEALNVFTEAEKNGKRFAACILDLTIHGGVGGKEIVFQMRKIRPDAVIFAASGYSDDPVIARPLDHGFTSSIVKPFTMTELSSFLGAWLI